MEPKWQQEIEEILLEEERIWEDKRHYALLSIAQSLKQAMSPAIKGLKNAVNDEDLFSNLKKKKDKVTRETLSELVGLWGDPHLPSRPTNYRESHYLIKKHWSIWGKARWRVLYRYKRARHMKDIDAPEIIKDNEERLIAESFRYLTYVTKVISLNLFFDQYRPKRRHYERYRHWLKEKLKVEGFDGEELIHFLTGLCLRGAVGITEVKGEPQILFYFPKGHAPKGLEKTILVSSLTKEKPSNG